MDLTPSILAAGTAVILSLLATYVPGFNTWHAKLSTEAKQLLWAVILLATVLVTVTWHCETGTACLVSGWREYLEAYVHALLLAVGANQGAHRLMPEPEAVKVAKLEGMLRRGRG